MFDEASSFLDIKQRMTATELIRSLAFDGAVQDGGVANKYILVVEHDLAVLDYMSDTVCCLYGELALVSAHSRVDACKPSHTGGPRRRETPLSRHHVSLFFTATTARR